MTGGDGPGRGRGSIGVGDRAEAGVYVDIGSHEADRVASAVTPLVVPIYHHQLTGRQFLAVAEFQKPEDRVLLHKLPFSRRELACIAEYLQWYMSHANVVQQGALSNLQQFRSVRYPPALSQQEAVRRRIHGMSEAAVIMGHYPQQFIQHEFRFADRTNQLLTEFLRGLDGDCGVSGESARKARLGRLRTVPRSAGPAKCLRS